MASEAIISAGRGRNLNIFIQKRSMYAREPELPSFASRSWLRTRVTHTHAHTQFARWPKGKSRDRVSVSAAKFGLVCAFGCGNFSREKNIPQSRALMKQPQLLYRFPFLAARMHISAYANIFSRNIFRKPTHFAFTCITRRGLASDRFESIVQMEMHPLQKDGHN